MQARKWHQSCQLFLMTLLKQWFYLALDPGTDSADYPPSFLYPGSLTKAPYVCTETTSPLAMLNIGGSPSSPLGSDSSLSDIVALKVDHRF